MRVSKEVSKPKPLFGIVDQLSTQKVFSTADIFKSYDPEFAFITDHAEYIVWERQCLLNKKNAYGNCFVCLFFDSFNF